MSAPKCPRGRTRELSRGRGRGIRPLLGDERGSILPLVLGYAVLALTVVLVVTAATSLHLERKRLFTLADGAALAGAEAFTSVRDVAGAPRPLLTTAGVSAAVTAYLADAPHGRLDALEVVAADTVDGIGARVTLAAQWKPPIVTALIPAGLRIEVTAEARTAFR